MLQKQKKKNGTDISWKQILNNQNCCKSIFFTQAPEHETRWEGREGGEGDFEIYEELAYNRKNSLCTHPLDDEAELVTHNLEACISILEVIAHPEGVKKKKTRHDQASLSQHTNSQSLNPLLH